MRRSLPLPLLAAAALACAGPPTQVAGDARDLRSREGVCAGTGFIAAAPYRLEVVACLRKGSPGTPFDNGEARLVTVLEAESPDQADLTHWHLIVSRDGEKIMTHPLEPGPSHRRCVGLRCRERVADVIPFPEGIAPGKYTLAYRCMSEEAYLSGVQPPELTIDLR